MFIGHPNRDVSAHQWDNSAFQWVNIGLYSQTRRRIEGSLASDRLKAQNVPHNTVEYFKAIAEQREAGARTSTQLQKRPAQQSSVDSLNMLQRLSLEDTDHFASLSSTSGSTGDQFSALGQFNKPFPTTRQAANPAPGTVTRNLLEDPFVTPKEPKKLAPALEGIRGGGNGHFGAMNFDYVFPGTLGLNKTTMKTQPSTSGTDGQIQWFKQQDQSRGERIQREQAKSEKALKDIVLGEDAMSTFARLDARQNHLETVQGLQKVKARLSEVADHARRPEFLPDLRAAVPVVARPPPGLTIANPYRVSTLNANATPYIAPSQQPPLRDSESDEMTNPHPMVSLKFSDPDGARPAPVHEIATGLGNEQPTPQNFRGPFFTHHMPTPQDPTTPLSVQVDWEDKLKNWWTDGQRPARQQDFSKTIIANAKSEARSRGYNFGAIGESLPEDRINFESTRTFVQLYETLSAYVEETRGERPRDHFTRAWKVPTMDKLDHRPKGVKDVFEGVANPPYHRGLQSFGGSSYREIDIPLSWTRRYAHGQMPNGSFGRPI